MPNDTNIRAFIADWFARFDRLDPIEAFLPDLHPDVERNMPDLDTDLTGHDRVRLCYAGVLETLRKPTEHHVSEADVTPGTTSFEVLFRAKTKTGNRDEAPVSVDWQFAIRSDGRPPKAAY
ncbi:MAG: hypothetical protein AB3N19_10270 [Ruegeria sp.]